MRINAINYPSFKNKSNINLQNKINFNISNDCFIKTQTITFKASKIDERQKKIEEFTKDLKKKYKSKDFCLKDIEKAVKKQAKDISVKPLNEIPEGLLQNKDIYGLYCAPVGFDEKNQKFFLPKEDRILYINFDENSENNIALFAVAVHEFTHVLQDEDKNFSEPNILNNYLKKENNNINLAYKQARMICEAKDLIEQEIVAPVKNQISNILEDLFIYELSGGKNAFNYVLQSLKITDLNKYAKEKIDFVIEKIESRENEKIDKKLLYDILILQFKREVEAYKNEEQIERMHNPVKNISFLTQIETYKQLPEILNNLKRN